MRAPGASRSSAAAPSRTAGSSASSRPTARASASWTRRWSTSRARARSSCSAPRAWRIEDITRDRVVVTPAPGEPGKLPFWKASRPGASARARPRDRPVHARAARSQARRGPRSPAARGRPRRMRPRTTWSTTLTNRPRRPGRFRMIGRSSWSGSATRSATGACASCRRSARRSTRRGRSRSRPASRISSVPARRCCGPTTASWCACPRRSIASRSRPCSSSPTRSRTRSCVDVCPGPRCSRACSARRRRGPCCSRAGGRGNERPSGSSGSGRADLLVAAAKHPDFPMLLEATRECLRDVFDVPALREVMAGPPVATDASRRRRDRARLAVRAVAAVPVDRDLRCTRATPPLAERRAAALSLDRDLLRELLGAEELRELLDPAALDDVELELQRLAEGAARARRRRRPRSAPRPWAPAARRGRGARLDGEADALAAALLEDGRAIEVRVAGTEHLAAVEDAGRLRDALGVSVPRRRAGRLHRADRAARSTSSWPGTRGPTARSRRTRSRRRLGVAERPDPRVRSRRWRARDACSAASSDPAAAIASGATPTSSGGCGDASLAALRREVEPVDAAAVRAVPAVVAGRRPAAWGRRRAGRADRRGCRARRSRHRSSSATCCRRASAATARADLDALVALAAPWSGSARGRSAPTTAAWRCCSATAARLLASAGAAGGRPARRGGARRDPRSCCASAAPRSGPTSCRRRDGAESVVVLAALWDLVWCGRGDERHARAAPRVPAPAPRRAPPRAAGRAAPSRPAPAGRARPPEPGAGPSSRPARGLPQRDRARARPRDAAPRPPRRGHPRGRARRGASRGASPALYPVLSAMEDSGTVRRGYFVAGLGAAQFALPGAVDRLRAAPRTPRDGEEEVAHALPPPIRPSPTAPRSAGPRAPGVRRAAPARSSCWPTARPPRSSSAARRRS